MSKFLHKQVPVTPAQKRHQITGFVSKAFGHFLNSLSEAELDRLIEERDSVVSTLKEMVKVVSISPEVLAHHLMISPSIEEYGGYVRNNLDLEFVIHSTLEYLINKVGATNAAVFLPVTLDEFTLAGYVNYDLGEGSPELLLNHLADVVAPQVEDCLHLTTDEDLSNFVGDEVVYLLGSHLFAIPCWCEDEILAVVVLFRDGSDPFLKEGLDVLRAIAPIFGQRLAKIVKIHQRHLPNNE